MEEIFQAGLIVFDAVLTCVLGWVSFKLRRIKERDENAEEERKQKEIARDELLLDVARVNLLRECNRYIDKGFAPLYAVQSIEKLSRDYHKFGGNGGIEILVNEFMKLPHKSPKDED